MSDTIQIGKHTVGEGQPVFIIAEIGSNHDKDFDQARRMIDAAADCGADAVKFQLALDPPDFKAMVSGIRDAEASLGSWEKRMLPGEAVEARRDSLRAARDLAAGETVTAADLASARPANGIRPRLSGAIVGRTLARPVKKGDIISWEDLSR